MVAFCQPGDERADIAPLCHSLLERNVLWQDRAGVGRPDLDLRMDDRYLHGRKIQNYDI